ncbi:TPA: hypothetical protein ACVBYD_000705 [Yersinia enterocolitica]
MLKLDAPSMALFCSRVVPPGSKTFNSPVATGARPSIGPVLSLMAAKAATLQSCKAAKQDAAPVAVFVIVIFIYSP